MLDNDKLTYSQPKRGIDTNSRRLSERALLTPDRAQKLDLLIHLLSNLKQSLIVCGPEGIGKTTLLKTLESSHQDVWPVCLLQGSSTLSFESVASQLSRFLKLKNGGAHFDISALRNFCNRQKVVLLIDDADQLLPGLINELIDLAESLSGLRLVFAMNYDEYKQQTDSEQNFDNCHFIELPPLNQRQCLVYLQNLSAQPNALLSFSAITDTLVEELYQETQGIPGKLLTELPKLGQYQNRRTQKLGLPIGLALILIITGFAVKSLLQPQLETGQDSSPPVVQTESTQSSNEAEATIFEPAPDISPIVDPEQEQAIAAQIQPEDTPADDFEAFDASANTGHGEDLDETVFEINPTDELNQDEETFIAEDLEPDQIIEPEPTAEPPKPAPPQTTASQPASIPAPRPADNVSRSSETDDGDLSWIMAQSVDHYTIQLMVLSSKDSVTRFLKKYHAYRDQLKYFTTGKTGQERYVLIYGSFQSAGEALESRSNMPEEFNDGIVKRFKSVQKQARR